MDYESFLTSLIPKPDDVHLRQGFADWLEEGGNSALAEYLRLDPEVRLEAVQRVEELRLQIDPELLAVVETLLQPFRPFSKWGHFYAEAQYLPFGEPLGTRGKIVTFAGDFQRESAWDSMLGGELQFLISPAWGNCAYGAMDCPVLPFACEIAPTSAPLTGRDVIAALRGKYFASQHISTLDATEFPFAGYNPGTGAENDEIHNDFSQQFMFQRSDDETDAPIAPESGLHGEVASRVVGGKLWYVLLHDLLDPANAPYHNMVFLFAVGLSASRKRLIGVTSTQVCHNLCD